MRKRLTTSIARGYKSRLGLALHLIGCERSESFLDQSQSVARQISDYFRHSIENCAKWNEKPSFVFVKNIQLSLHLQVCLRKFKRLDLLFSP